MKDPRIDVILENLNIQCKFYDGGSSGYWCKRAFRNGDMSCGPKFVHCEGQVKNCELTENDRINETGEFE